MREKIEEIIVLAGLAGFVLWTYAVLPFSPISIAEGQKVPSS